MRDFYRKLFNKKDYVKYAACFFILLACIYIPLHVMFEKLFSETIVKYVLIYIEPSWYNDSIFMLVVLATITMVFLKWKRYIPSKQLTFLLLLIAFTYLYYRINGSVWNFTPTLFAPGIKYADIFILTSAADCLLLIFKQQTLLPANGIQSFFTDESIGGEHTDELGYSKYAANVSNKIKESHFKHAFAIGINGKWGLGKTSFIDLIKRNLIIHNYIQVNFNPWNSQTPSAIIKDFFDTLQEEIRPYHSNLSRLIVKYADKLVNLNDSSFNKNIQASVALLSGTESLTSIFYMINQSLKEVNIKVVIYIDDLDRLDKDEIVEVLRLIRNTANFYNTFFVVAYDKNYVANALKDHNAYNYAQFLEKIFQIEVTIPYFNREILREKLAEKLKYFLPEIYHPQIDEAIKGSSLVARVDMGQLLETMRDVTRLCNSLTLNGTALFGEVEIKDFIRIELLRIKYPSVYQVLYNQKGLIFTNQSQAGTEATMALSIHKDKQGENTGFSGLTNFEIYLRKHFLELNLKENEIGKIQTFVSNMFSETIRYVYQHRNGLSIIYPSKFDRYFAYSLFDDKLSEIAFSDAIKLPYDQLAMQIDKWTEKGLTYELQKRLMQVNDYDSKEDFEKIIRVIFYLARKPNPGDHYPFVVGYDGTDLMNKLNDYNDRKAELYYKNDGGKDGLRNFIKSILSDAESPYDFESQFVQFVMGKLFDESAFPLTHDELLQISIGYLRKYCESATALDNNIFSLFWHTESTRYVSAGGNTYRQEKQLPDESKGILKEFVKKDLNDLILRIVEPESLHQKTFTVAPSMQQLYDGWDNFKTYIFSEDEIKWTYLKEFKSFYLEAEKDNFRIYVPFDFVTIPIADKLRNTEL